MGLKLTHITKRGRVSCWRDESSQSSGDMVLLNVGTFSVDPDMKVHGANMGPIWGRQDPGGPHVGPTNFAICQWVEAWLEKFIIFNTTPMDYNYKFYDFIIHLLVTIISTQYH